jgi:hypothetical protein
MRNKMFFASGFAMGYILGARAGRERYEQIMAVARRFAENPQVQHTTSAITHQAGDVLGNAVQKAADVGGRVGNKVVDRFPGRFGVHGEEEEAYAGHGASRGNGKSSRTTPASPAGPPSAGPVIADTP